MPQYNSPTLGTATTLSALDKILIWVNSLAGNQIITAQNFANALKALMSFDDDIEMVTGDTTLTAETTFTVANSASAIVISVPLAVDNPGKRYRIANKGSADVTVERTGLDTISGETFITLSQYEACEIESDGEDVWFRLT